MSETSTGLDGGVIRNEPRNASTLSIADWLGLAAAPTFALMALLTGLPGGSPAGILCAVARVGLPLSGMAPMYALMSIFHVGPWLKLIASRRSGESRS